MTGFIYFIPGPAPLRAEDAMLSASLISRTERGIPLFMRRTKIEDALGTLVTLGTGSTITYDPEKQTWLKSSTGKYSVGAWNDAKPGPGELERAERQPGETLRLDDGNTWLVPRATEWIEIEGELRYMRTLPSSWGLASDGTYRQIDIHPDYAAAWDSAVVCLDALIGRREMTVADSFRHAVLALSINYRVGPEEIELLGALRLAGTVTAIIGVMADFTTVLAWVEKKKTVNPPTEPLPSVDTALGDMDSSLALQPSDNSGS